MKIIVNNLKLSFNDSDEGADQHNALNMLETINSILQKKFPDASIEIQRTTENDIEILSVEQPIKMTKRVFGEYCDTQHVYGTGKNRFNTVYFDWKETEQGRGFKFGLASSIQNCSKADLFKIAYDWIVNEIEPPYYVRYKFAKDDKSRFKTPIVLNF